MPLSHHPDQPIVSVIMPTYNRYDYLSRSINSFQRQSFENTELIIVDDGSEDRTFEIVSEFMKLDERIRYLRHSHRCVSRTKNAGICAAFGKYISFLDSDDEYLPDYLEKRVKFMEENSALDLIHSSALIIGDPYVRDKSDPSQNIHLDQCIIGGTFFGKREVFAALGGFDISIAYSEDSELWDRATWQFTTARFDHPGYVYYRNTENSICSLYELSLVER